MASPIIRPNAAMQTAPVTLLGGKGAQLMTLGRYNAPVPDWFCVSTPAFTQFVQEHAPQWAISANTTAARAALRQHLLDSPLPTSLQRELEEATAALLRRSPSGALSVRSSATVEDSAAASYAGQFDTFLGVTDVRSAIQHIKQCWASLWAERVFHYQQQAGAVQAAMAVVVQVFIPADVSGVMFTANPITQALGECVIEASWGLGELIVSGQVMPDHFVLDISQGSMSTFAVLAAKLGSKAEGLFWNRHQQSLERKRNLRFFQQKFVLEAPQLTQLAAWGLQLQNRVGRPQDIEWALHQDTLYILQARPITTIAEKKGESA